MEMPEWKMVIFELCLLTISESIISNHEKFFFVYFGYASFCLLTTENKTGQLPLQKPLSHCLQSLVITNIYVQDMFLIIMWRAAL